MSRGFSVDASEAEALLTAAAAYARQRQLRPGPRRETAPKSVLEWALRYRRIEDRPFSLENFKPLRRLYQTHHPHTVVIKPAQRGVSEYGICFTCYALLYGAAAWTDGLKNGLNVGYIFPTASALYDFAKERLRTLAAESPDMAKVWGGGRSENQVRDSMRDSTALNFRQVGNSFLYLRGANAESGLLSFPADIMILDEFDRVPAHRPPLIRKRMNASPLQWEMDISTPTTPAVGISAEYNASDQHVYQVRCGGCGEYTTLDFFRDVHLAARPDPGAPLEVPWSEWRNLPEHEVILYRPGILCPACRDEMDWCGTPDPDYPAHLLDDAAPVEEAESTPGAPARWIALRPEVQTVRGYRVPWYGFRLVRLETLVRNAVRPSPTDVTEFHNSDLGLEYAPEGAKLTRDLLHALALDLPGGRLPEDAAWVETTMGVDVGRQLHVRVTSRNAKDGLLYARFFGTVPDLAGLERIWQEYSPQATVIDANPETHLVAEFQREHLHRVYRAYYTTQKDIVTFSEPDNEDPGKVTINRTALLDDVLTLIRRGEERWPAQYAYDPEIERQMCAPTRTIALDKLGNEVAAWVESGADHYYHACAYDRAARLMVSWSGIGIVGVLRVDHRARPRSGVLVLRRGEDQPRRDPRYA